MDKKEMKNTKKAYLFYSVSNFAETWRDPDDLHYAIYRIFSTLKNANKYLVAFFDKPDLEIKLDDEGKWYYKNFIIEKFEMDGEYDTSYRQEAIEMRKWAEELGMVKPESKNESYKSKYLKNLDELK